MFDESRICPYPGLRSFNEEESIFFKGREDQIEEVVDLLQNNKFLMVTGASGDGKSSLIFAGLVPNARAGFFKAVYNNWQVSHFRPERDPIQNFARSLATIFTDIPQKTLETELNRGFSSLVDIYKNSPLYFDPNTKEYQEASEEERKSVKRKCANLLIVVDQFEEFFTNIENFNNGVPSLESQTLVNVLLETTKIAQSENLPIYVVFTMRSDYIGQCTAFRGLAEYIGFSQFFVPRLKRKDLQQVIEEPAALNGDEISRRLVERLLYDLSEGVDQLPILQHVLSQVWLKASEKSASMDLLHYAMVGGMPRNELPEEDLVLFDDWFHELPDWKKSHFEQPGLRRVLDIHANELYQTAWERYTASNPSGPISIVEAKRVIAIAFACLTKIDDSRAVRNLMSIEEITRILNRPNLTTKIVERVLLTFREQGNTFIRPFVDDNDPASQRLTPDAVLDITHESLIRNWDRLNVWATKEFEYYETFLDFKKQLEKWLESGKSRGYLLPIGPLTYFETWYNACQPNIDWINRYLDQQGEGNLEAAKILADTKLFLKKSRQKVAVTRAFIKYGTTRLLSVVAIIFVLGLSGFYYFDSERKQNASVLETIKTEGTTILNNTSVSEFGKGYYLNALERTFPGALISELDNIDSMEVRVRSANAAYMFQFSFDNKFDAPVKNELTAYISEMLRSDELSPENQLQQYENFLLNLVNDEYNNPGNTGNLIEDNRASLLKVLIDLRTEEVKNKLAFRRGFNHILNLSTSATQDLRTLVDGYSPFEPTSRINFDAHFPANGQIENGYQGGISHNGGYQILGSLFAGLGDSDRAVQCLDTLLKYNPTYMEESKYDNAYNMIGYFLQYGYDDQIPAFIDDLAQKTGTTRLEILRGLMDRTGFMKLAFSYYFYEVPAYNYGLSFLDPEKIEWLFNFYEEAIREDLVADNKNFELALLYKQRGTYMFRRAADQDKPIPGTINDWFSKAVETYKMVSESHLMTSVSVRYRYYTDGFRRTTKPRWYLFLYPDHFVSGWYNDKYTSPAFANYLIEHDLLTDLYKSGTSLEVFNDWIANYHEVYMGTPNVRRNSPVLNNGILASLRDFVDTNTSFNYFDKTFLSLLLSNAYFSYGEEDKAFTIYEELSVPKLQLLVSRWEYLNYTFIENQILQLAKNLALRQQYDKSKELLDAMTNNNERSIAYSEVAKVLFTSNERQAGFSFLDSAFSKSEKTDLTIIPFQIDHRYYLMNVLSGVGGEAMNQMAYEISNKIPVRQKDFATTYYVQGIAYQGNYYRAFQAIPSEGPYNRLLFLFAVILSEESAKQEPRPGWEQYDKEWNTFTKEYIFFNNNF